MFRVRRMTQGDYGEVLSLLNEHFPHVGATVEKLTDRLARGAHFFVAESGGRVIGFVDLQMGRSAFVRGLAVAKRWRGKGVGTALLERAIAHARKEGKRFIYIKVRTSNEKAIRVYQKKGFVIIREKLGVTGEPLFVMRKGLEA